jgi:hypothetical protein
MQFYWLLLGALSVWRITHLLNAEDGPWDIFLRLRRWVGEGWIRQVLGCFYCLSLWIAAPLAAMLGASSKERLLLWPALSGIAILLERLTACDKTNDEPLHATYVEDTEENDGLLR